MKNKRAIILAGGKGTRLKPYTIALPKPLVPIGDVPILEIIIKQLKKAGFSHITITLNHMGEIIQAFFGNGDKWDIKIDYTFENKPLSTMGPLSLITDLPDNFLVMNGDVLTDINYSDFYEFHLNNNNLFTIASHRRKEKIDYGVLNIDKESNLIKFEEKPSFDFLVSMGIYMVNNKVNDIIPKDTFFGFDHLMEKLITDKNYPKVYEYSGYWLDIGRPSDYEKAINDINNIVQQ